MISLQHVLAVRPCCLCKLNNNSWVNICNNVKSTSDKNSALDFLSPNIMHTEETSIVKNDGLLTISQ